ncbi:hypothetical protein, partial [Nocardia acididurans]|uniref:hypothetical protein n=1 Tax=Nocardia acididurans TaxID=2802282 RepID=UPI001E4A9B50
MTTLTRCGSCFERELRATAPELTLEGMKYTDSRNTQSRNKTRLPNRGRPAAEAMESAHSQDWAERGVLAAIGIGRIVWGVLTALASRHVHRMGNLDYPGPDQGVW